MRITPLLWIVLLLQACAHAAMTRKARRNGGLEASSESVEVLQSPSVESPALAEELEEEDETSSVTSNSVSPPVAVQNDAAGAVQDDDTAGDDDLHQDLHVDLETAVVPSSSTDPPAPVALRAKAASSNAAKKLDESRNATANATQGGNSSMNITTVNNLDPTVCDPPCMEGRGVCNDNICFCKHPFTGSICQKDAAEDENIRPTTLQLAALCAIATLLGVVLALLLFSCAVEAHTRAQKFGAIEPKKEVWRPAN
mmetsp:Transcript_27779/g.50741  ORF Transcript_27779/g.50741 Transcript_27779/m.50741 type:complete len:255 (+) Transcript_27779:106-870(+)